jgi:type IV pilus assembly protein PilW
MVAVVRMAKASGKHCAGFTLVELLVGMAVSVIFAVGIVELLVNSRQTFKTQNALAQMQEDGAFISETLNREIRRAGYKLNAWDTTIIINQLFEQESESSLVSGANLPNIQPFGAAEYLRGGGDNGGALDNTPDSIMFRYQIDDPDDLNATLCGSGLDYHNNDDGNGNVLFIGLYVDGNGVLQCAAKLKTDVNNDGDSTNDGYVALEAPVALIANVENLRFLYGEDTDNDSQHSANRYLDAAQITDWTKVVSVRLSLVLRSDDSNISLGASDQYMLNGQQITAATAGQGRLYQVFSTTVALRNKVL